MVFSKKKLSKINKTPHIKKIFLAGGLLVGAIALAVGLDVMNIIDIPGLKDTQPSVIPTSGEKVDLAPPTQTDKDETNRNKQRLSEETTQATNESTTNIKQVTPIITNWGVDDIKKSLVVSGYAPSVLEQTGKCTLIVSRGGHEVRGVSQAQPNVQNMTCGEITIPLEKLSNGSWKLVLIYESASAGGSSSQDIYQDIRL